MLIKVRVFNDVQVEILYYETEINAAQLIEVATGRVDTVRRNGKAWAQGAVPFFGKELVEAVMRDNPEEIERNAISAAMAAWLCDSEFQGVTAEEFKASDLDFSLHPTGMVVYNRKWIG
ncbi:hypothetical protein OGY62_14850 [Citrobacter sp. CK198]|uniref:hypothetical protein n=1 Tax=Citrobacter sp. CK198 TaxID=2985107 RepID=UPI00257775CF|nr:hypothetical protein [Citrobacter sp. CK198]MDM2974059.1 hypothetical protein [Citrobacter sp. CK198]